MSKSTVVILVVLGCILLAVANVALWASLDLFTPGRFGERIVEGLQSDAAGEALAGAVVDRIMEHYPDFPRLAQIPAKEVVAWLLQRPALTPVLKDTAAVANAVMTTSAQGVIGIDLSRIGPQVVGVVAAINSDAGAKVQTALESAQESGPLAIFESGFFPKLRGQANTAPWLWPLAGLGAIALFAVAYVRASAKKSALKTIGIGVFITGALVLVLIPALQAPVQNSVPNPAMRIVVGELLNTLTRGLAIQCLLLGTIGVMLIVASYFAQIKDEPAAINTAASGPPPA